MNHLSHDNGNNQVSELGSDTTSVVLRNDEIKTVTYGDTIERRGVKMRKVTKIKLVPRRTFIKGTLKGKYWGEHENNDASPKDIGQFYNITLYESEISVDREVIRTEGSTTFSDFLTEISRANSFTGYQNIDPSQLKNNFLKVHYEGSVNRYKIDLHEPRLYNTKIVHALHQLSDHEVFGSIESNICGYLLDKKEVVEESYEVVEDISNTPIPPISTPPPGTDPPSDRPGLGGYPEDPRPGPPIKGPTDPPRVLSDKRWLLPLLLILLLCLLAFASPGNNSLWILPIAALLFFAFQKSSFRLPNWVYAILFLFLGLMLLNAFRSNPAAISDLISNFIDKNFVDEKGHEIGNDGGSTGRPEKTQGKLGNTSSNGTQDSDAPSSGGSTNEPVPGVQTGFPPKKINKPTETISDRIPSDPAPKLATFNTFIDKGLKAVEDEEYTLANQNFRQASSLDPSNPRLRQLADRYKKLADEKCQDFRSANAKELMHIPNNYYQYAASLTQTVPLKCE